MVSALQTVFHQSYLRMPLADMHVRWHLSLTSGIMVTLHMEWWKMLTMNRSSCTLGQVPRCLRISKPLPTAVLVRARHCSQGFADTHSFNPHNHLKVENWGTERLSNSQGPSSCVWLLSPRSLPPPCAVRPVTCLPACLSHLHPTLLYPSSPPPYFPDVPSPEMLFPTLPVGGSFPLFFLSALFFFWGRFHSYHNLIYTMHMSVDLFIV